MIVGQTMNTTSVITDGGVESVTPVITETTYTFKDAQLTTFEFTVIILFALCYGICCCNVCFNPFKNYKFCGQDER